MDKKPWNIRLVIDCGSPVLADGMIETIKQSMPESEHLKIYVIKDPGGHEGVSRINFEVGTNDYVVWSVILRAATTFMGLFPNYPEGAENYVCLVESEVFGSGATAFEVELFRSYATFTTNVRSSIINAFTRINSLEQSITNQVQVNQSLSDDIDSFKIHAAGLINPNSLASILQRILNEIGVNDIKIEEHFTKVH